METSVTLEWAATCSRVGVGLFLALAAVAKLRDVEGFARTLGHFPGTERLSVIALRPAAVGIAVTELWAGALFAAGIAPVATGPAIVLMLAVFTAGLVIAVRRGTRVPCGCLGRRSTAAGWGSVARNLVLIALAGVGAASAPTAAGNALNAPLVVLWLGAAVAAAILVALSARRRPRWLLGRLAFAGADATVDSWRPEVARFASARKDGSGSGAPPSATVSALAEGYSRVRAIDERAVHLLAELEERIERELRRDALDADLAELVPSDEPAPDWLLVRERMGEHEAELVEAENELNEAIAGLYRRGAAEDPPSGDAVLTRLALLHWSVLVRRTVMDGLHTKVDGLEDDPDCRGGVVSDRLLARYFDALFETGEQREQEVAAVRALVALARQSACLGTQQSAILASALYWSFVELRAYLRLNGLERLVPYVAQAGTNALLLFYDVEKWRGAQEPLSRFFREHQLELSEGVRTLRHPSIWHGLWLYDRRTGHLIGYAHSKRPLDENQVDLEIFLASIAERENLGRGECSFAEMVQRGATARGYTCSGSSCDDDRNKQSGERSSRFGEFLKGAGFSMGTVKETSCGDGAPGDGGNGGGDGRCAGGLSAGGQDRVSSTIACLTEQAVGPTERFMKCFAEATGLCANPVEKATKGLQEAGYHGVKLGRGCEISAGMGDVKLKEYADQKEAAAQAAAAARDKLNQETVKAFRELQAAAEETEKAAAGLEEAKNTPGADDDDKAIAALELKKAAEAQKQAQQEFERKQKELDAATEAAQKAKEEAEKAKQQANSGQNGGTKGRCPPDTPNCGGNGCSGMSEAALQTMKCWEQATAPEQPFERDPGYVDPAPDDVPSDSRWLTCFEQIEQEDAVAQAVAKQCWAVDCGRGFMTAAVGLGACGCSPDVAGDGGGGMQPQCGHVDCQDGSPVYGMGGCRCSGGDAGPSTGIGGGFPGPIPEGGFKLDTPDSFTTVRGLELNRQQPDAFSGFPPGAP
jgi:hypothetical protein